jgi:hypothetical protein
MEPEVREDPRPANDSRKRTPVEPRKAADVEKKPSLATKWRNAKPTKMILFWACLASIALTMLVGFTWGGWMTAGGAQEAAETMAKDAVVQRLAPICVAQFNQDPDKDLKLGEMNELSGYGQSQYVRDQGWATISGEPEPNRKVADACIKLLSELSP